MKNLFALMITISALAVDTTASTLAKPKYGPAAKPFATTLFSSHSYFQSPKHPSPDFWALIGYYVPQYSGAACSAASITMALNAARAGLAKGSEQKLILQPELVDQSATEHWPDNWKDRLSLEGSGPKKIHGVSLDALRDITESAFRANGFPNAQVKAVHVRDLSAATLALVHHALVENEKSANDFILANFNQQIYTDDAEAGHIAPVGAYDAEKKRVLILDPDREWYEPYWIDESKFIEGMHTKDGELDDFRGFLTIKLL
jgi:hypothetical protein